MSTRLIPINAAVTVAGMDATPMAGTVTLDETTVYATADLRLPLMDPADIEDIDPRDGVRAEMTLSIGGETPRSFDLGIRSRTVDHADRTIQIVCASDEALLGDYAPLTNDLTALGMTSLRAVVNYVLGVVIPGASLEASPADDALATMLEVDNLAENPSLEVDTAGWSFWTNSATGSAARTATTTPEGGYTYRGSFTSTAAGPEAGPFYTILSGVKVGTRYTSSAWVRTSIGQKVRMRFEWKDGTGTTLSAVTGTTVTIAANTWTRLIIKEMVAPVGAERVVVTMYGAPTGTNWTNGTWIEADGLRVGPTDSEPLTWQAGVTAWDYLMSLTSAAQLRLFCDEQRAWRLVPMEYTLEGVVAASPATARRGEDTVTRDGDLWADGVVARYKWDDADGTSREVLDTAGVAGKVQVIEFDRPYPGPGAAAFRLNRLKGQGRVQQAEAFTDYAATPGMEARITLPGTLGQFGRVQSVTFDIADGFMTIGSRSLTDVGPSAYSFGDPGITYADVPVGLDYATFEWSAI